MRERGYLSFWPITTMVFGFILIALIYFFLHSFAFPNSMAAYIFGYEEMWAAAVSFGIIMLILGIVSFVNARRAIADFNTLKYATEHQEIVKVISKASQVFGSQFSAETTHSISFEFSSKIRKNFVIDATQYNLILEGETGTLTYKQNGEHVFFVHFQPFAS